MSIYGFYDIYNNEININSDTFDSIVFRDIFNDDVDSSISSVLKKSYLDDIRNDSVYTYTIKLKEFLDTRMNKFDKLPVSMIEPTGSLNSVLMSTTNGVVWKKLAKPVTGYIRVTNIDDDSIILTTTTMLPGYFEEMTNCSVIASNIVTTNVSSVFRSIIFNQGVGENEWSLVTPSITTLVMATDCIPEKSDMANKRIVVMSDAQNLDSMTDVYVMDKLGVSSKVNKFNSRTEVYKTNDVKKSVACSKYAVSIIGSDGQIKYYGQTSTADYMPPVIPNGFSCVNAGYYSFVGVGKDNKLYSWGYNSYTSKVLIDKLPIGNDFVYADLGFNYGLALKEDKSIVWWGYDTYIDQTIVPVGNNFVKIVAGYRTGGALDSNGKLYVFAKSEYSNLLANAPTNKVIKDFDINYQAGIYLTTTGEVGTWGTWAYTLPSFAGKTIVKVFAGMYMMAALTDKGELIKWGYSYIISGIKNTQNVVDIDSSSYFGALVTNTGKIETFAKSSTMDPEYSVIATAPDATGFKAIMSGSYLAGVEYDMTLNSPIFLDDPFILTTGIGYAYQTGTTKAGYTMIPKKTLTLGVTNLTTGYVTIDYEPTVINSKTLCFYGENGNKDEQITKIELKLKKTKIGE